LLTLLIALPQVFISTYLGAAAVTPFNLGQRLFNLFAIPQNAFMLPLWPAYSDAKARRDFPWIRRTLGLSLLATAGIVAVMAIGAWQARPLLTLWVGKSADLPSTGLIWVMFAWNAVVFFQQPFSYLLSGVSEVRRLTFYGAVSLALTVCLMFLFAEHEQEGIVFGVVLGCLPLLFIGNIAETVRLLRSFPRSTRVNHQDVGDAPQPVGNRG
jgi:O-antigen/teichoic acid export membrane protein